MRISRRGRGPRSASFGASKKRAIERTRTGDTPLGAGSDPGKHKVVPAPMQIHERVGRLRKGTVPSISAVQIAGHHGERENRY